MSPDAQAVLNTALDEARQVIRAVSDDYPEIEEPQIGLCRHVASDRLMQLCDALERARDVVGDHIDVSNPPPRAVALGRYAVGTRQTVMLGASRGTPVRLVSNNLAALDEVLGIIRAQGYDGDLEGAVAFKAVGEGAIGWRESSEKDARTGKTDLPDPAVTLKCPPGQCETAPMSFGKCIQCGHTVDPASEKVAVRLPKGALLALNAACARRIEQVQKELPLHTQAAAAGQTELERQRGQEAAAEAGQEMQQLAIGMQALTAAHREASGG